ncbi:hypothetical protein [Jejuia spongiicola]|uniref:Lipocalin-like domain-containing protein n=1 Tax=Jejuia spongiicola TaxID=2942207 RepID=A0ABT0QDU8_9FLAO|nr:hypothetical protein [Jejuia spongiicola]MCL6294653.1 hypothetical protein [Jejuia spongiicola]
MRILIILTLILGNNSCKAQSISENKLIGKWILVAETDSFPDDIKPLSENDSESNSNPKTKLEKITLIFKEDYTFEFLTLRYGNDSTYKLTDSTLTLGNRNYVIIKLDKNKLIYKDKSELFNNHYEYKKIE